MLHHQQAMYGRGVVKRGIDPLKDVKPVTLKGHDQSLIALLNGDVDALLYFKMRAIL